MQKVSKIKIVILSLLVFILCLGCEKNIVKPEDNTVYMIDENHVLSDSDKNYIQKNRLIEIPLGISYEEEYPIYVKTHKGYYPATIHEGNLYYIGNPPIKDCAIVDVIKEIQTMKEIKKEDIEKSEDMYFYNLVDGNMVGSIMFETFEGECIDLEFIGDNKIRVDISDDLYDKSEGFKITLWIEESILK